MIRFDRVIATVGGTLFGTQCRSEVVMRFVCTACKLHVALHGCQQGRYEYRLTLFHSAVPMFGVCVSEYAV